MAILSLRGVTQADLSLSELSRGDCVRPRSGEREQVTCFTKQMKEEGRFAVPINCCGSAAHSSHVRKAAALLKSYTKEIIQDNNRLRSRRWISSSVPEAQWTSDLGKFASAEYIENNVFQPVLFHQALKHVPSGSVVIEVSPKGFFQTLLTETVPNDCIHVAPMIAKATDKLWHFFQSTGKMYTAGLDLRLEKLYPSISTPVPTSVPFLSHLIKWDHTASWKTSVLELPLDVAYESAIDIEHPNYAYLAGHKFESKVLMPAAGLICTVWNQIADMFGKDNERFTVQFQNVVLSRTTTLSPGTVSTLVSKINSKSGMFTVENEGDIIVTGKVRILEENSDEIGKIPLVENLPGLVLNKEDVYKELSLVGCNYLGLFRGIETIDINGHWADIAWNENWTCFLDAMLQTTNFCNNSRQLGLPVDFEKITIDPVEFKKNLQRTFDETGGHIVRVYQLPNQRTLIAPGIEIKGLELRKMPQVLRLVNLAYERHTFYPFFNKVEDPKACFEEIVDLMLENLKGSKKLEVADVFINKDNSLALDFKRIVSRKPGHEVNHLFVRKPEFLTGKYFQLSINFLYNLLLINPQFTISMITLGTEAEKFNDNTEVIGGIVAKTKESLVPQVPTDIVLLDDSALLTFIVPTIKTNGFVLVSSSTQRIEHDGLQKCSTRLIDGKTFDLYRKVQQEIPEILNVSVDSSDFEWVPELQEAILKSQNKECRIFVTSQQDAYSGILGLVNCLRLENGGEKIRCIFDPQRQLSLNFKQPDAILKSIITNDLFVNVQKNGSLGSYRHVCFGEKEYRDTTSSTNEAFLGTLRPGDLSSFRWIESSLLKNEFAMDTCSIADHRKPFFKRYQVAYAPLNFRDVLLATNAIPLQPEKNYSGPYLGYEFSGFDPDGNQVMGICHGDGLATSVMTDSRYVWQVPKNWTLEEAATVPIAYGTILYAFNTRANLQRGQTVLIHAGAGAVGQAAISVALGRGCQVFTTVGSPEKREYIKQAFPQLTDNYIGNSRDTSFERQVMEITNGRGVDVALNSLAGDKLIATYRCVAPHGSFLEIGVFDAFMNTEMGMRPLLKNINVCGLNLSHMIQTRQEYGQVLRQLMDDGIRSGVVKPLPRHVFECNQVEEAFRLMTNGKHMGKLVIRIRDEKSNCKEAIDFLPVMKKSYFTGNKTYLIVGGLGGLGLEVAGWMIERGARKIVLNSRSGVTTGFQALCLRRWREAGVQVETPTMDLTDKLVAGLYIRKKVEAGEVFGGIFNLAINLRDAEFSKQTPTSFYQVSLPKVNLTKILDEISRELSLDLEYFVTFSSFASGRGIPTLSNYGWANSSMERICEKRREDGLHGLAIQWGVVRQVGIVAETLIKGVDETLEIQGAYTQSVHSFLEVLDAAMQQPFPTVSSCVVPEKGAAAVKRGEQNELCFKMGKIFGIVDFKGLPADKKLSELGLDSLVSVQLKQTLERDHDILITKDHIRVMTVGDIQSIDAGTFDVSKFKMFGSSSQEIFVPFMLHKTSLVSLKECHPTGQNVFIVHGLDGGSDYLKPLASRLNANVYAFQFSGKDGWNCVTELAGLYLNDIKLRQPTGPFTIMGFSGGTAIAFEIALKLQGFNEYVENLVFLDGCASYETTQTKMNRTIALNYLNFMELSQNSVEAFEPTLTGDMYHNFMEALKILNLTHKYELAQAEADAYAFLAQNLASHIPCKSFNGDIVLIQATDPCTPSLSTSTEDYNVSKFCTGEVLVRKVKGNHFTFLTEEYVDATAGFLNAFLK